MMYLLCKYDVVLRTNDVLPLHGKMMCACGHMKNCEGLAPNTSWPPQAVASLPRKRKHHVWPKDKYIIFIIKPAGGRVNRIRLDSRPTKLIKWL
jgi:hypothetical protein